MILSPFYTRLVFLLLAPLLSCHFAVAQLPNNFLHVTGIVLDLNGSAIEGACVSLKRNHQVITTTNTDADGRFDFVVDDSVGLSIEVNSEGFALTELRFEATTTFPLRITLIPQSISAEVTITATRTPTRIADTAASLVLLNTIDLQTTAATTLDDALRQVAGFSLFRRSGSRTANPTTQGVSLRSTGGSGASRALVLADGVPLNDPFGGWIYWDRVPRESISQVEVLLGGASHLYGSAALGGVIDIATKRATTNNLSFATSYGNKTSPNASLFAGATNSNWAGSIAAEGFHTDGYVLLPEFQSGLVDTPAGTRDAVLNLKIERKLTDNARIFATGSFFGEARRNGTPLQTNRTHLRQFGLGGSWTWSDVGSFVARAYGGTQLYDQNFSAVSTDRNSETLTRVQRVPAQVIGGSVQWSRTLGRRQTLVAGVEGREVRGTSDETVYVNSRASSFVSAGGRERTTGVYFEDLLRLNSRLFFNLGTRIDHWRNFVASSATRPISAAVPPTVSLFPDRHETAFSPHGSIIYRLNDRVSLLASMSRAFRAPTLNELYRSFRVGNVVTLANENLTAERLTGGEAGARITSQDQKFNLRTSFFWNDITRPVANVTLTTTPALITRQRQNLGRTRSQGLELQADVDLTREWNLSSSYMFSHATVVEFPVNRSLEGLWIPQVPRHQFTLQLRYMNPSLVTVGLQARASSSQFDDDLNQFRLDPYFTLDLIVSRKLNERFEVFGAVENLFDDRYQVGKTPLITLGPPILLRAGFRIQLGGR